MEWNEGGRAEKKEQDLCSKKYGPLEAGGWTGEQFGKPGNSANNQQSHSTWNNFCV